VLPQEDPTPVVGGMRISSPAVRGAMTRLRTIEYSAATRLPDGRSADVNRIVAACRFAAPNVSLPLVLVKYQFKIA